MTAQLSEQRLLTLLYDFEGAGKDGHDIGDDTYAQECDDIASIIREVLQHRQAGMGSKPVAYLFWPENDKTSGFIVNSDEDPAHKPGEADSRGIRWISSPLYAAPPAPVAVPELKPVGFLFVSDCGAVAYSPADWPIDGFNLIGQIYGNVDVAMLNAGPVTAATVPEGWKLVPVEPTKEMIDAGWSYYMTTKSPSSLGVYGAMLAAAPEQEV